MNETEMTERLDQRGLLDQARGSGVYALAVDVPNDRLAVEAAWDAEYHTRPPNDALQRMANAEAVAYVGASKDVYARLCDHANGEVRQSALLRVFDADRVLQIVPHDNPFQMEFNVAAELAGEHVRVWQDGALL